MYKFTVYYDDPYSNEEYYIRLNRKFRTPQSALEFADSMSLHGFINIKINVLDGGKTCDYYSKDISKFERDFIRGVENERV